MRYLQNITNFTRTFCRQHDVNAWTCMITNHMYTRHVVSSTALYLGLFERYILIIIYNDRYQ